MLRVVQGDLLDMFDEGKFDIIAHGANCFNTMGAGIAGQIAKRFPGAERVDRVTVQGDIAKLGNWSISVEKNGAIYNFYTQYYPGKHFDIDAFRLILRKFRHDIKENFPGARIGLPLIGCGIGGGKRDQVERVIRHELYDQNVTIVEWPGDSWKKLDYGECIQEDKIIDHIQEENP